MIDVAACFQPTCPRQTCSDRKGRGSAAQRTAACRLNPCALAQNDCVIGAARLAACRKFSSFRPARGPGATRYVQEAGLQGSEQVVWIHVPVCIRYLSHVLFFDQMPLAGQPSQDTCDDLAEQRLQLLARQRGRCVEYGRILHAALMNPV